MDKNLIMDYGKNPEKYETQKELADDIQKLIKTKMSENFNNSSLIEDMIDLAQAGDNKSEQHKALTKFLKIEIPDFIKLKHLGIGSIFDEVFDEVSIEDTKKEDIPQWSGVLSKKNLGEIINFAHLGAIRSPENLGISEDSKFKTLCTTALQEKLNALVTKAGDLEKELVGLNPEQLITLNMYIREIPNLNGDIKQKIADKTAQEISTLERIAKIEERLASTFGSSIAEALNLVFFSTFIMASLYRDYEQYKTSTNNKYKQNLFKMSLGKITSLGVYLGVRIVWIFLLLAGLGVAVISASLLVTLNIVACAVIAPILLACSFSKYMEYNYKKNRKPERLDFDNDLKYNLALAQFNAEQQVILNHAINYAAVGLLAIGLAGIAAFTAGTIVLSGGFSLPVSVAFFWCSVTALLAFAGLNVGFLALNRQKQKAINNAQEALGNNAGQEQKYDYNINNRNRARELVEKLKLSVDSKNAIIKEQVVSSASLEQNGSLEQNKKIPHAPKKNNIVNNILRIE